MNTGKRFESEFKASVPADVWYYRFRDGTASFYGGGDGDNIRFQQNNICDCMLVGCGKVFLCELKSHKGKSIPFNCIRDNQIQQMQKAARYQMIVCLLVVHFADTGRTFAVSIDKFTELMKTSLKKSANIAEIEAIGIEIAARKLKVNYRYGLDEFLKRWR